MEQALQCQEVIKILLEKRNIIFPHARETLDAVSETQTEQQDDSAPEDPFFVRAAALLGPAPEKPAPLQRGASKQEYKEYMKAKYNLFPLFPIHCSFHSFRDAVTLNQRAAILL